MFQAASETLQYDKAILSAPTILATIRLPFFISDESERERMLARLIRRATQRLSALRKYDECEFILTIEFGLEEAISCLYSMLSQNKPVSSEWQ